MSVGHLRLSGNPGMAHPAVLDRRVREFLRIGLGAFVATILALGIIVAMPKASVGNAVLVLGAIAGVVGIVALILSSRYEVTVTLVALYLVLLDGPIKLGFSGGELTHGIRNVLILAIGLGAVLRLLVRREPVRLPPLSGWVLTFVAVAVLAAFNPRTGGILKVLGGFRQELQWVPFFFFGFVLMRSKKRLRQFCILVGVCALANGIVATYQTGLSPGQLATWGPGYRQLFQPTSVGAKAGRARTYGVAGEARARPVGLGSDSGFSGGVGLVALPCCLALLATWRSRRRWVAALLALGALLGVATGLGRLQVVGAGLGVVAFGALAVLGGRRVSRPLASMVAVVILAIPAGVFVASEVRSGTFQRYNSLISRTPSSLASNKAPSYTSIPKFLDHAPFGIGLGTVGPVGAFGGKTQEQGRGNSAETQYNFIADELGAPGLVVWIALILYVCLVMVRGIRRVTDGDLAILLAGVCAPFMALIVMGLSGPTMTSSALGPYFWFAIGIVAYWFGDRRRSVKPMPEVAVV
jgi:hypothetical protein